MEDARWLAGDELTFVWDGCTLMLDVPTDVEAAAVDTIWSSLVGDVTLSGILQTLTEVLGVSLLSLPDFAVALVDGSAGQFAARGRFRVEVSRADGPVTVEGVGVTTWSERAVDGIEAVTVGLVEGGVGLALPLRSGVVRSSRVEWGQPTALAEDPLAAYEPRRVAEPVREVVEPPADLLAPDPEPAAAPDPVADDEPLPAEPEAVPASSEPEAVTPEPEPVVVPSVVVEPSPEPATGATTVVRSADDDATWAGSPPTVAPPRLPDEAPSRFAAMWGDTVAHSLEEAAVRIEEEDAPKAKPTPAAAPTPQWAATPPAPAPYQPDDGFISAVPGRGGLAAAPVTEPVDEAWSDHDGETVVGFSLVAPAVTPAPAIDPEKVLALVCINGHPNRPHHATCRTCGAPLSSGITGTVPRPPLGQIRSSTGEVVPLTGPVLIGRSPRASRFQGTVTPTLLSLPYPHISSTHLEVRLEGWNVFAVDLNSRNGAYLRRHDEPPVRVTHTPLMLADGDVIDFGHGVSISFEGMP